MARGDYPSSKQDQFVLRFPDGLRDRIKSEADRNGRSMNAEIIRVLEREFPAPAPLDDLVNELMDFADDLYTRATERDLTKVAQELHQKLVELKSHYGPSSQPDDQNGDP